MKHLKPAVLLFFAVMLALSGFSCKKKSTFGELLIECEKSMHAQSMTDQWPARRAAWEQEVINAANDIGLLKRLLIEYETNIQYAAQKPMWRDRRDGWLQSVSNASSLSQLGYFLMELEGSFTFATQYESWQENRGDWINRLQSLQ